MISNFKESLPSNRKFGFFFSAVFLVTSIFFFKKFFYLSVILFIFCLLFFFVSIFRPIFLYRLNLFWFKLGIFLGSIISPIIISLIFYLMITPLAILFKLIGRDELILKKDYYKKTYWIENKKNFTFESFKKQF